MKVNVVVLFYCTDWSTWNNFVLSTSKDEWIPPSIIKTIDDNLSVPISFLCDARELSDQFFCLHPNWVNFNLLEVTVINGIVNICYFAEVPFATQFLKNERPSYYFDTKKIDAKHIYYQQLTKGVLNTKHE